jgi:hypothetical protein
MDFIEIGMGGLDWTEMVQVIFGHVAGFYERGNEHLGSIEFWEYLDKLRNY